MGYFPVDDQMAFHRKIVAAENAAVGLWTRAGSWAKREATGGFVPTALARQMGTAAQIRRLVEVGLWEAVLGGYLFHDWSDYGTNESGAVEEQRREERRAGWRERKQRQRGHAVTSGGTAGGTHVEMGGGTPPVIPDPGHGPRPHESKSQEVLPLGASSSVPETSRASGTDQVSPAVEFVDRAMRLRVDFRKVAAKAAVLAEEPVEDDVVWRILVEALGRAKERPGDRTGLVLTSLERDWPEWSRLVFQVAS